MIALVSGVTGQDGVLLARTLRARGMRVVGLVRPGSPSGSEMAPYLTDVDLVPLDLTDHAGFAALVERLRPTAVFNLGAHSSVGSSWSIPERVRELNQRAVEEQLGALVALRARTGHEVRYFQASSAEEHGDATDSPYAQAKAAASAAVAAARDDHGLFACAGFLHPHESTLRRRGFVVRKIARTAAAIKLGRESSLTLGTLAVTRDWGAAVEHVEAMARMLEVEQPADLVIASGVLHTLREVVDLAFAAADLGPADDYLVQDADLTRPQDSSVIAPTTDDLARTETVLGWRAQVPLAQTVAEMVAADLVRLQSGVEEHPRYLPPLQPFPR